MSKYFAVFKVSFLHALKNTKALIGLSIFLITCLIIFANLWKYAAARIGALHFEPATLLWYIAFNEWALISIPDTQDEMEKDLRSGRLAYQLPRPISYLGSLFAQALGTLSVNLIAMGMVTFLFTFWQTGSLPFTFTGLSIAIVFGFLAGMLAIIFQMLVGLSAFWLQEVSPFYWIWEKLLFMFGGLMLPLSIYPEWMQTFAQFTPFPAILGQRSALALHFDWQSVLSLAGSFMFWSILGIILVNFTYRRGLKILNIEGG